MKSLERRIAALEREANASLVARAAAEARPDDLLARINSVLMRPDRRWLVSAVVALINQRGGRLTAELAARSDPRPDGG